MTPTPATSWTATERAVVRRARRRVAVAVALVVIALLTLVGGIGYSTLVRTQEDQIQRSLRYAAAHGELGRPVGCMWLFGPQSRAAIAGDEPVPAGFPQWDALAAVAADGVTRSSEIDGDGTVYHVLTQRRSGSTVQAVLDARYQLADRRRLLTCLALAGVVGLLGAAALGLLAGRRTVAPLAEALARQRRFVADASHELRVPITQLHTRTQLLARRARLGGPVANQDLERLVGTTRLLGEIVDDLLRSARLSAAGPDQPATEWVDLPAVAEAAVTADADRAVDRGVRVTLSRPDAPIIVPGIASALRRVVGELLTNALTHTPPGGHVVVTVRRAGDGRAELVVADTGAGFEPADARRIFDRFHRGPDTGDRRTGLGLALLREVVAGHGGTVEATGRPGNGATFTVRLPAAVTHPALPVPALPRTAPPAAAATLSAPASPGPSSGSVGTGTRVLS